MCVEMRNLFLDMSNPPPPPPHTTTTHTRARTTTQNTFPNSRQADVLNQGKVALPVTGAEWAFYQAVAKRVRKTSSTMSIQDLAAFAYVLGARGKVPGNPP